MPIILFEDSRAFEQWLEEHHAISPGIWLQIAKKDSGLFSVSYGEALEVALCYGWIDSHKEKQDDRTWLQRFTPRGSKSVWSKVNKEKAERLIGESRMKPAGLAAIEAAKQNGEWDKAYESFSSASVPEDFEAELNRHPQAKACFDSLNRQNQYAILYRLHQARTTATRIKRIQQFLEMLEKGEKLYP
ncbi:MULTISPECIES: YdeI/OmpD-associated family protein [Paenibacillus]|uniref:YdeI/OmpD-associated family protein n=1 Tax=Paenibacillus TaxID=44249 RepID=UPI001F2E9E33|nr:MULTISPECIES: YdeI/OmpD-associated family protein [Paenibacillus]